MRWRQMKQGAEARRNRRWLAGWLKPWLTSWTVSTLAVTLVMLLTLVGWTGAAAAADNPELLPDQPTSVIDLARIFTEGQRQQLEDELAGVEEEGGWKLRVLTQYDRTPGRAVKPFWGVDNRSLVLIADPRGGNLLNFNVGQDLFALMPRTYWVELQTRFGNQYYVRDHGEDGAILDALGAVETCLARGGCSVVPGLPQEQWVLTLISSMVGGVIAGFAAHPRKPGDSVAWTWVLLLAPLWVVLFVIFGLGPVITRTSDWLPLTRNVLGFAGAAVASYMAYYLRDRDEAMPRP